MWGDKKSHTPQAVDPGLKNVKTNQSLKATPAFWERTPKMNNDAICPTEATADRAAGAELACERRNLGQRGPVH